MGRTDQVIATLPNGLRAVCIRMASTTEFCGLTVNAGSRDEVVAQDFGLAHFVEHTIFKGTTRRTDSYINSRMEAVGGELNAFTTKEETTLYAAMPAGNFRRACMLIGELASESVFPTRKIDLEREVICDEIDSYLDSPMDAAYDLFDEMVFAGNPMAHNILGNRTSVDSIDSERCRRWLENAFTASAGVFFYLGSERPDRVIGVAEKAFASLPLKGEMPIRVAPNPCPPTERFAGNTHHQSHTVMGVPVGGLHSPDRHAIALATNILGGPGMNALLNVELRERRGLVYTVEASAALMSDCGMMTIYFGCDHDDRKRCCRLVQNTLNRFADKLLTEKQLNAYKRQYLGQLTLGLDNKEQLATNCGRALLHGLNLPSLAATTELIAAITPQALRDAAQHLAAAPLRSLTI
ncbi:MAG: insulinase family protein [Bacteroides sp.]|nr:insulinase family protein [Bacteroides sp.]MCM1379256.1 insulinase family protein [Bacteroides sp.]MCM1445086.1 insulinase family protein [Prevotella sp.]